MENMKFEYYQNLFDKYTSNFIHDNNSKNIKLKIQHSYAVSSNMEKLGKAMNFSYEALRIAKIIGLFHDIARFSQYEQYSTFRDDLSFNHAQKGVEIIESENILKNEFKEVKRAIKKSILNHNKEKISANSMMDDVTWLYTRMIRDADKLDIYETIVTYHLDHKANGKINPAIELDLPEDDKIHPKAIQDIMNGKIVKSSHIHSINDLILLQMGWVFDINFTPTMQIIKDNKYIPKLAEVLPKNKNTKKVIAILKNKIDDVLEKNRQDYYLR